MKWRAFGRTPQWVRLSEWLGIARVRMQVETGTVKARYSSISEKAILALPLTATPLIRCGSNSHRL